MLALDFALREDLARTSGGRRPGARGGQIDLLKQPCAHQVIGIDLGEHPARGGKQKPSPARHIRFEMFVKLLSLAKTGAAEEIV